MSADSLLGQTLDEYRLVAVLGQGGMARVYRGLDLRLQRAAAIKVIDTQFRADPEYAARFEREARTIAQLDHPHIVRLYRYGNVDGLLYMAMQFIPGASLEHVLASYRAEAAFIEPSDACRLVREVCLALDYAHAQGVIHRDVKPANILLDQQGRAILSDFGLALLADVGTRGRILGSPHYVAPEQALSSAQAVPQSDLYALGIILYEMFTGEVPFQAREPLDVALMQVQDAPRPPRRLRPALSPALEAVILKALAKEPAQRYASGAALVAALEQALRPEAGVAGAGLAGAGNATPSTVSRLSIPDRVALQMAKHPAGIPAPAAPGLDLSPPATAALAPPPWKGPAPTLPRPSRGLVAGLGVSLAVVVLAACGLLTVWLAGRAAGLLGQAAVTRTATSLAATPAPIVLPTALATPAPATAIPAAGPELLLIKGEGDNSLVIINRGAAPLRLAPLTLGEGNDALEGSAWELSELPSGACVAVWRDNRPHALPDGVDCELVGAGLERENKERFWRSTFSVFYAEARVATCEQDEQLCTVSPP